MKKQRQTEISKYLSYVLRHNPQSIGLVLEDGGWANIEDLVIRTQNKYADFSEAVLRDIVCEDNKQRYSISGKQIRAQQGHSVDVGVIGSTQPPPVILYHGTTAESWAAIQASGTLLPMGRQHVHLSADLKTAVQVASRRKTGKRIVLIVHSEEMHECGHTFQLSGNGVWLTDAVPIKYTRLVREDDAH